MNEVAKIEDRGVPEFDTGEDGGERLIQGHRVSFTNEATWVIGDDEALPEDREFAVVRVLRVEQKWPKDGGAPETRILAPGEKFRDAKVLNEQTPREEWREGPNGPQGPWQNAYVIYMVDLNTAERFTFVTATVGGHIASHDLAERVKWMRQFRGPCYPIVRLTDTFMSTRFGGRQRPDFDIRRWISFGGSVNGGGSAPQIAGPTEVTEPSAAEVTDDSIPF